MERACKKNSCLPRHADVAQTVGTIAGNLDFNGRVAANQLRRFVIQARHQKPLDQEVCRSLKLYVIGQPVGGDDHRK